MPQVFIEMKLPVTTNQSIKRFRVAFSFAGEKREFVAATADILAKQFKEDQILYDKYHEAEFADADLAFNLPDLYKHEADLIVAVFSRDYEQKEWCGLEWRAIFSLIKENQSKRILLSRFDLQDGKGLFGLAGFVDLDSKNAEQFATLILQRLALILGYPKNHYTDDKVQSKQMVKTKSNLAADSSNESKNHSDHLHKQLAYELLEKSQCYLNEIKAQLNCSNAREIINCFSTCQPDKVLGLFNSSRKALNAVRFTDLTESDKQDVFVAVTSLYLLAAMRLIDGKSNQDGHVIFVPRNEHIVCAIIATALFGGRLKIVPNYETLLPQPEFVFEIHAPGAGDYLTKSFERAMYVSIYQNNRKVNISALDSQELSPDETSDLKARLQSIREIDENNLCLIVTAGISANSAISVSNEYHIPTLFQSDAAANVLLGMTHHELTSQIKEFWRQLNKLQNEHLSKPTQSGVQPMQGDQITINAEQVNFATSKGANSIVHVGDGQSITGHQQTGLRISELSNLINLQMIEAINAHPSERSREALKNKLEIVQNELAKPKPDKNLIERALESVKEVGEAIEGGEKIVELCLKALPLLTSLPLVL